MKVRAIALAGAALLALAGCDKPKPRTVPNDPMALPAEPAATPAVAAAGDGLSVGLPKRPEFPGFYLDRIGDAPDPLNKKPAVTAAGKPIALDGFGFDPVAKVPAKGVDVVIDGKAYGTQYGHARQDVATFNKIPGLVPVGYRTELPAGVLAPGAHAVVVRVIAADGKAYFESPVFNFEVK